MQPYMTLSADVLIVGGGSAGVMAAIRAKQMDPGQRVVVFEKGDMQYSGCIARGMDAMNIVAVPGTEETPELYVETNREACQGIMDEPVNYAMAKRTWAVMKELMDWGVCFPVDEKGQFDKLQIHSKGKFCITMKEPELKTILAKKAYEYGAEVYNRIMTSVRERSWSARPRASSSVPAARPVSVCLPTVICTASMTSRAIPVTATSWPTVPVLSFPASNTRWSITSSRTSTRPSCTSP